MFEQNTVNLWVLWECDTMFSQHTVNLKGGLHMEEYISVKQMSELLNISIDTAYEYVHTEDFPLCRIGRTIRIPKEKLQKWLEKRMSV